MRPTGDLADPVHATKAALRRLATAGPAGVGIQVASQLLITTGDNPDRLHSEACGVPKLVQV
jgi:hypothetical protein